MTEENKSGAKPGLRESTMVRNTDLGKLARMKPGESELFFAPDGVAKKMRSLGAYFVRLGGSKMFSQVAIYGVIPGNAEICEIVLVKRIDC